MTEANDLHADPIGLMQGWLFLAEQHEPNDPNAAALATADAAGMPSVRMVLIKRIDQQGLRFFTNATSRKGIELSARPAAAVSFHWKSLRRQIRVEGAVERLSHQEASEYFRTRSRGSQIAAAVSAQSRPLVSREVLESQIQAYISNLGADEVPVPQNWVGYLLKPNSIEFWEAERTDYINVGYIKTPMADGMDSCFTHNTEHSACAIYHHEAHHGTRPQI